MKHRVEGHHKAEGPFKTCYESKEGEGEHWHPCKFLALSDQRGASTGGRASLAHYYLVTWALPRS